MTKQHKKPAPEGFHYMADGTLMANHAMETQQKDSYTPLFIILGIIFLATVVTLYPELNANLPLELFRLWMGRFMAGFFLVFSGFKLIDVRGFAEGYGTYDLLAKKVPVYGLVYPFIELVFGLGYLLIPQNLTLNVLVAVILSFSSIGVIQSLLENRPIKCACLGTALNIPLSSITVIEDLVMALMAILMIIL